MEHDRFAHEGPAGRAVRFERHPDFIYRRIADEAVLIPVRQPVGRMDCFYTLNEVAAFVWQMLDRPCTQAELHAAILDAFDVGPEAAAEDLSGFLLQMVDIGAVCCAARGRGLLSLPGA